MGPGLDDYLKEGNALSSEWKTPPLWGIGLIKKVNKHTRFLHDGRARSIEEAIIWHGGEAEKAKNNKVRVVVENRLSPEFIAIMKAKGASISTQIITLPLKAS